MHDVNFIVREPLLDPKQTVLGYEFSWQFSDPSADDQSEQNVEALVKFIGQQLKNPEGGWLLGDNQLFFSATPELLLSPSLQSLPAKFTVLTFTPDKLVDPDTLEEAKALREAGYGISIRNIDLAVHDKSLVPVASHVEIRFGAADFASQAKIYGALKQSPIKMIGRQITTWKEYDSCSTLGINAFIGKLYLTPRAENTPKGLNPAQGMILQLMDMVRKNADVRQLEGILKRDAALSYKLLRYINSAGFGLGTEIQSLRHAVTMLGYSPLYRWLSVLLTTASAGGSSPVLMQTAIVRGRFVELLGKGFLPKSEAENLFVTGMFSLLDRLLGVPMEKVLESIQLSEAVTQALLSREGVYGPFLALAEACEVNNGEIGPLADALFVSPSQVNEAHMAALAWAQTLKL